MPSTVVRSTTRSWLSIVREADPEFDAKKRKQMVYDFSNGRKFYDKLDPYAGTSTST